MAARTIMRRTLETRENLQEIAGRVGYWARRFGYGGRKAHVQTVSRSELRGYHAEIEWDRTSFLMRIAWPMDPDVDLDDLICHELTHISYGEDDEEDHCDRIAAALTGKRQT